MNYKKTNWPLVVSESLLVGGGTFILIFVGYGKIVWPALLFYTALKISILGAIENMFDKKIDEKIKEFNSRNTAISYTDESD